jgi:DNA-binding NarL/FixJ family response regulator
VALKYVLESTSEYQVVGEAGDGAEALRCTMELLPDLLLMDLSLQRMDGLQTLKAIRRTNQRTRILILTAITNEDCIFEAIRAGADGYALKDISSAELHTAIKAILVGEKFLSPAITTTAISALRGSPEFMGNRVLCGHLTSREREVLKLVAEGVRTLGIAECLGISPKTVERHRSRLMKHLGVHNVSALTTYAIHNGLAT